MATVNFYLDTPYKKGVDRNKINELKKSGKSLLKLLNPSETSIYLILTLPGRVLVKERSHEKIPATQWDFDNKLAKRTYMGSLELNDYLVHLKGEVLRQYRNELNHNKNITVERIRELVKSVVQEKLPDVSKKNLQECVDQFIYEKKLEVKKLTVQKYNSLFKVLKDFYDLENTSMNKLFCENINHDFDLQFRNYLIESRGLVNDTISKYYECLKVFLSWARKQGYNRSSDFEDFKIQREKKDIIFLRRHQLDAIINLDLSDKPKLDRVRDLFVFQTFTGQRFSDAMNLKQTDIVSNQDDSVDWHLYQIKGDKGKKVQIPMLPDALRILEKYNFRETRLFVFKRISNVKANEYLKEIGELAKLDDPTSIVRFSGKKRIEIVKPLFKFISTHMARRNFVSLSIENGLSPEMIIEVTGHEDTRVMRKYLKIHNDTTKQKLFKAWEK